MRFLFILLSLTWIVHAHATDTRYAEQAISLRTATGDLQGSLLIPEAGKRVPVVLLIAGSGPTDRDGNTRGLKGRNDSLKMLATALAQAGFASVRYDKRGIAASAAAGASESELRFDAYVDDAVAWMHMLKADKRFDRLAVIGHSEGSLIGMLAAKRGGANAFVSIAGPAQGAATLLRQQLMGKLNAHLAERSEAILTSLEQGKLTGDVPPELHSLYRKSVQRYLISWFRYAPYREFATLSIPAQIIQGDTDIQVGLFDARELKRARPDAELLIVKGMNHVLKTVPADTVRQLASYSDSSLSISEGLSAGLTLFLKNALVRRSNKEN